jgi:glycosyltransferase involved in cell wall biosynthesis
MTGLSSSPHRNNDSSALTSGLDSPRITVITPAHNVSRYIGEAIHSVLAQTYTNFQYIVVNDGSTDTTADEVARHAARDHRLEVIRTDHLGASNARNVGLDLAKGRFIAFLDADDRWHPEFLENQLALLESAGPEAAAVFARSRVMSEQGRVYYRRWQRSGRFDFDDMLIESCPPRTGSSLLIRKEAFDSAGQFDVGLSSAQDLDMWLRIQSEPYMPYFIGNSKYLLDIRVRPGAISRDHKKRFIALDSVIAKNCPKLRRYPKGMGYVRAAVFAFRAGEDDFAERWARLAKNDSLPQLLKDSWGWRLLAWSVLTARQRQALRRASMLARSLLGRAVGVSGGILR